MTARRQGPDIPLETGTGGASLSERHKDAAKSWVPKVRRELEEDFSAQLGRLGLRASGKHEPAERTRLGATDLEARRRLEALISRDALQEGSPERGFKNVVRELAYTLLNRVAGLKAMEARKVLLLPPPGSPEGTAEETEVITPVPGQARSRYLRDFRAAAGSRYKYEEDAEEALLRDGLTSAFRYVTREIRVLFDPDHEYSCIWPSYAGLSRLLQSVNKGLPGEAFVAPDFLGWVYQFFRQHENDDLRAENKGTPRTSYELGVMNQFYTPGWVVKALVDNSLGRLWLQMHPDSALAPNAKAQPAEAGDGPGSRPAAAPGCAFADYLVPRTGERIRFRRVSESGRVETFKRAKDIAFLDPACGTMHFGQYAFTLFQQMYLDEIAHAGEPGWPAEPSVQDPRDIPAAILENNLFGIDIDPRAIQIAALSLLLTAKEAALRGGFSPLDVRIRRTNLTVASGVKVGEQRLRALVEAVGSRLGDGPLRERLFTALWENLQYVGELGSLIQVREGVAEVLEAWVESRARDTGLKRAISRAKPEQLGFGAILTEIETQRGRQMELERQLLDSEAREIERELTDALEATAAESDGDPADRLFAEDTARGLQLLRVLSRRYDVVAMNPPYGDFVPRVKEFVRAAYPRTYSDIYAAFIDRATQLVEPEGYVAALVSRTFVTHTSHERLRTEILLKRNPIVVLLDLGEGILEATVHTAALVLRGAAI